MSIDMVLSITVGILSLLVTALLVWQIYSAITIEKRLRKLIKNSETRILEILNSKISRVAGEIRFDAGQEVFNQQQYYPAFCRFLEALDLFCTAKHSGGVVMSQWFILQSIEKGNLKLSEEDRMKLKSSLQACYADSDFIGYREQILRLII